MPPNNPEHDALIKEYTDTYLSLRAHKMEQLFPEERKLVQEIEERLDVLTRDFESYLESKNEQEGERIEQALTTLFKNYAPKKLRSEFFLAFPFMSSVNDFIFHRELTINRYLNKLVYEKEIMNFLKANVSTIIENFLSSDIDPEKIVFHPVFLVQETHNQGKAATIIEISHNGSFIKKIMFKPRNALIDKAILESFKEINKLSLGQRSGLKEDLPIYKILSFQDEDVSLWDFVEGPQVRKDLDYPMVGDYVSSMKRRSQGDQLAKYTRLEAMLNRMDKILTTLQCSDLHGENIIIKDQKTAFPKIVPIDLENIKIPKTGKTQPLSLLGGDPDTIELTEQENGIIEDFKINLSTLPFRHILLGTNQMINFMRSHSTVNELANLLVKSIKENFDLISLEKEVHKKVTFDILSGDVPYFTEQRGTLYYGQSKDIPPIGSRRT